MPKEQYMCQLCANHGIFNQPKKGHKQKCSYKTCPCDMCALNTKRRTLDQIERQLRTVTPPITVTASSKIEQEPKIADFQPTQCVNIDSRTNQNQLSARYCPYTQRKSSSIFRSIKFLVENA
ncbi:CBN-MAB-23 protein [Aphelenchoides bicaudatus]|nr:CBN-MAB-23 protein [Aphelenchoides bicaudatus]